MLYNTFSELEIKNLKKIKKMINKYKDNMDISDEYKKIIILYNMSYYMKKDNRAIIFSYIDTIMSAPNIEELCKIVLNLFTLNGISSICSFTCEADYNDSKNNILHIDTTDFEILNQETVNFDGNVQFSNCGESTLQNLLNYYFYLPFYFKNKFFFPIASFKK